LVVSVPAPVAADPFTITSGLLGFRSNRSVFVLDLSGPGFSLPTGDSNPEDFGLPGLAIADADPAAATFPVSGHILVDLSAPLQVAGVSLPDDCCRRVLLDLTFTGPPVAAQETLAGVVGTGAFAVSGQLLAFLDDFESPPIVQRALVGRGTAAAGFLLAGEAGPEAFATYIFEVPAAVPEPATLVLFGTGAVACLFRRKRGRG
jgi:hypothetical protein